jgi:hypothetical protein
VTNKNTGVEQRVDAQSEDGPFTWDNLMCFATHKPFHRIFDADVLQLSLGRSDYEAFSMYKMLVTKQLMGEEIYTHYGIFYPIIDFYALAKYGMREKVTTSNLFSGVSARDYTLSELELYIEEHDSMPPLAENAFLREMRWRRDRQFNWYRPNPLFESGTATVRGNEDIRVGDKCFFHDEYAVNGKKGLMAYTVEVANDWRFGQAYKTTLGLIRGQRDDVIQAYIEKTDDNILKVNE